MQDRNAGEKQVQKKCLPIEFILSRKFARQTLYKVESTSLYPRILHHVSDSPWFHVVETQERVPHQSFEY